MEIIKTIVMNLVIGIVFLVYGIYSLVDWIKNRKTLYWEYKEFEGGIPVSYYRHIIIAILSIIIGISGILNFFELSVTNY